MIKSHFVGTLFFWLSVDGSILSSSDALIREIWLCTHIGYILDTDTGGIWVQMYPERIKAKKMFRYSGYGLDMVKIRLATSWIWGGKKREKKN